MVRVGTVRSCGKERVMARVGEDVRGVCPRCGREGALRFYGDRFTSLQTGFEEWCCADWCGETTVRPFVLVRSGDPYGPRRYVDTEAV